ALLSLSLSLPLPLPLPRADPSGVDEQRLADGRRAFAGDGDADAAVARLGGADEELHFAAGAFELLDVVRVHEPATVDAEERLAEARFHGGQGEIDVEAAAGRVDVRQALGGLEGPDLLEAQEDERAPAAGDEAGGRALRAGSARGGAGAKAFEALAYAYVG